METSNLPEGFLLTSSFLTEAEEAELRALLPTLSYGPVRMHGVVARRRVAQFGWHYSFESSRLTPAPASPPEFDTLRARAAQLAGIASDDFVETLVIEYPPGAAIGWHRDAPSFGIVAGISVGSQCRMRFRKGEGANRETVAVTIPARSIYLLTGSARWEWQHTVPPVRELRYSITFRTLKRRSPTS
jgi:alkylated DNA repair dioxygenase AlkB